MSDNSPQSFTLPDALGRGWRVLTPLDEERCRVQRFAATGEALGPSSLVSRKWLELELAANKALARLEALDRTVT